VERPERWNKDQLPDFLEQQGAEALDKLLRKETVDALEHVFRAKTRNIDLRRDNNASINALNAILGIIAQAPVKGTSPDNPIRLRIEKTLQNLSVRFSISEDSIRRQLREHQQKAVNRLQSAAENESRERNEVERPERWNKDQLPDFLERDMLELCMMDPTAIYTFWETILPEQLHSPVTRLIYDQCSELVEQQGKPPTFDNLMTAFDDPQMKNYLIELEASGRKKFFGNEEDDIESALRDELTERWKEPDFQEKKKKLVDEIIAAFAQKTLDRKYQDDLNDLRSSERSEEEKTLQLLELQKNLQTNRTRHS
jgi:hypothetical protein